MSTKQDAKNYHELSKPFDSEEQAHENINNFFDEIYELRKKYKIPDVLITVKGEVSLEDGKSGSFINSHSYGNSLNVLHMAAFTYGQMQSEQKENIAKLLLGK